MRRDVQSIRAQKNATPLVVLTAYTAPTARLLDPHVDILLVGDTVGQVLYGFDSTLPVTLPIMAAHGAAVVRGSEHALVVIDLPYGTYEHSSERALENARALLTQTGASAVKLEGGTPHIAETIRHLCSHGVAVMGHVGLLPQTAGQSGDYRYRGRGEAEAAQILAHASAVEAAGAFAVVLEAIAEPLARRITQTVAIPTIGIGASSACDGQVLVIDDMLGMFEKTPRFVKRYAEMAAVISQAAERYGQDVRIRAFPQEAHLYGTLKDG